ncbi:MAG: hypothetical protein D6785_07765 [Planctomycetota bacterium]|nr:MAG: hypothetical protein D6785_07765 [Planctomycetota bacterium]
MSDAYGQFKGQRKKNILLLCEHAWPNLPEEYDNLGLDKEAIYSHYGWDIGAFDVFQKIAQDLEASGIYSKISRLLVDSNRRPHAPDLIRKELEHGNPIPGNQNITLEEREKRIRKYWKPYHDALENAILSFGEEKPILIAVHSFTPVLNGEVREMDIGLLYYPPFLDSYLISKEIGDSLAKRGYHVEYNKPYSVENPEPYPIHYYAEKYGLSYVALEINNRLIGVKKDAVKVGADLALLLKSL